MLLLMPLKCISEHMLEYVKQQRGHLGHDVGQAISRGMCPDVEVGKPLSVRVHFDI